MTTIPEDTTDYLSVAQRHVIVQVFQYLIKVEDKVNFGQSSKHIFYSLWWTRKVGDLWAILTLPITNSFKSRNMLYHYWCTTNIKIINLVCQATLKTSKVTVHAIIIWDIICNVTVCDFDNFKNINDTRILNSSLLHVVSSF